jgi:hypothetical protein
MRWTGSPGDFHHYDQSDVAKLFTLRPGVMDWSGARELQIPDSGGRTLAEAALCARGSDIAAIFPASSLPKAGFRPMVTRASLKIAVLAIGK